MAAVALASKPKIVVLGAGAIGGWCAARLALAGQPVTVVARGETPARINSDGLFVSEGKDTSRVLVSAVGEAAGVGPADLLIVAVKAPALAEVAASARPLIGADTIVLPMLNGVPWWFTPGEPLHSVDPTGAIAAAFPRDKVIGCVVHAACSRSAPNHIVVKHAERLILGWADGEESSSIEEVCKLFRRSGIAADHSADIRQAIWYKLWGNATINPVSALTRATADRLLADPATRNFMLDAMGELAAVGAAIGCPIAQSGEDRMAVTARLGAFKTSMLQDVEAGRRIELEALLGAPIEIARRHGVSTPTLDRLYGLTRLMGQSLELL